MNRNRLYFGLLILVLIVVIAWTSVGMLSVGKVENSYSVSVIVSDSNNDRWIAMREGLEQAASDNDIELNYVSTGKLTSLEEERTLINREIENGADGIIIQMISSENSNTSIGEIESTCAVMLIETDVSPEDVYAITEPDNLEMGKTLAETILNQYGSTISAKKIGVLSGNQNRISMQQRLEELEGVFAEAGVETDWKITDTQQALSDKLASSQEANPVDILISLGNDETETAVDYLQTEEGMESGYSIFGVGCSEKTVYYLDKGEIQTLIVPNEFNMGYQSMNAIAKQLLYRLTTAESTKIDFYVVDKENLYDEENQKTLFPIVQ